MKNLIVILTLMVVGLAVKAESPRVAQDIAVKKILVDSINKKLQMATECEAELLELSGEETQNLSILNPMSELFEWVAVLEEVSQTCNKEMLESAQDKPETEAPAKSEIMKKLDKLRYIK
ncbi:MAG: hypothetical protein AB8E15_02650 [Bdellovibrionales bacterium]